MLHTKNTKDSCLAKTRKMKKHLSRKAAKAQRMLHTKNTRNSCLPKTQKIKKHLSRKAAKAQRIKKGLSGNHSGLLGAKSP